MRKRILFRDLDSEGDLINLTPLLDVLFLILVFFILIAPLLEFDRIELAPSSENKQELSSFSENTPLKMYVQKDNTIWLSSKQISLNDLFIALDQYYKTNPNTIPQLYQDQNASFGTYQKIKNLVETIGFEQLDVVLKTE
ncbi:MAG: biopolymer transporter ExbD [Chlamydiae bacterium]|nr:biopolymer transporter ExbD [Chlamydiota bacterium]